MQRLKILVLAGLAVFAFASVAVGTASAALPTLLNNKAEAVTSETFTAALAASKETSLSVVGSEKQIKCSKNEGTSILKKEAPEGYLGAAKVTFSGCKLTGAGGEACTGEGDAAGSILLAGEAHLVEDQLSGEGTLAAAILFLVPRFHYTCKTTGLNVLSLVEGSLLCLITPVSTLATAFKIKCERTTTLGKPKEVKYWNAKGEEQKARLLTSIAEGEFKESAEEGESEVTAALSV